MREALIILTMCLGLAAQASSPEIPVQFPAHIAGGKDRLAAWTIARQPDLPTATQMLPFRGGEIAVIYHSSGSGRPLVDAYIYACNSATCKLMAMRSGILVDPAPKAGPAIHAQVDASKRLLTVTTSDGVSQLVIALPND